MGAVPLTEEIFNTALGNALKKAMPEWREHILIEHTGIIRKTSRYYIPPVAIEVSYKKNGADMDAKARPGTHYAGSGMKTAIAAYPTESDRKLTTTTPWDTRCINTPTGFRQRVSCRVLHLIVLIPFKMMYVVGGVKT